MNRSREGMGDGGRRVEGQGRAELGLGWDRGRGDSCVERLEGGWKRERGNFIICECSEGWLRGVSESKGVVELTQGEGYDNRTGGRLMKRGKGADWRARRALRGRDLD